ncbi:esterase/lipase family protein [Alkanindiges sp. WGS2144]|uniref:esterase/lipase family protein n=1 Tax=Alkanindiges sp. WGS2144 TaxID=3366808 RepID=UPI003753C06E
MATTTYLQLHLNNIDLNKPAPPPLVQGYGDAMDRRADRMIHARQMDQYNKAHAFTDEWLSILNKAEQATWHAQCTLQSIDKDSIQHLAKFNLPVYAMGYNWLQSNEDSAQTIYKKLAAIKAEYGQRFHKFIIISHSMGGLVTRRLAQLCGEDIAGVVHGVMPADGAAAAYRRIVSGSYEGGGLVPWVTSFVLGKNTEHVTAVLANSPGGLELLPNAEYNQRKPWLTLQGKNERNEMVKVELPTANTKGEIDPYEQIYKADKVWWEMVREELIDPANMFKPTTPKETPKDIYKEKIEDVKKFHSRIAKKYHPCTYVNYGHDPQFSSFGTLTWTLDRNLKGLDAKQLKSLPKASDKEMATYRAKIVQEQMKRIQSGSGTNVNSRDMALENNGVRYISLSSGNLANFCISDQNAPGDGTVPFQSGRAPYNNSGVKQIFQMMGFDHQGSYNDPHVKRSVLHSIVSIIKENNIQPKFR